MKLTASLMVVFTLFYCTYAHVSYSNWRLIDTVCRRPSSGECAKAGTCCGKRLSGTQRLERDCEHDDCPPDMLEKTQGCTIRCGEADANAYGAWVRAGNCERPDAGSCAADDTCCGQREGTMKHTRECKAANGCDAPTLVRHFQCNVRCGFVNPCRLYPNPCENGGTCVEDGHSHSCTCASGWTGHHCDESVDECASNPCQNGGTCTDGHNTYSCDCPDGFSGGDCSTNVDECASEPCQNGGACTDGDNTYSCDCPDGFSGGDCSTRDTSCPKIAQIANAKPMVCATSRTTLGQPCILECEDGFKLVGNDQVYCNGDVVDASQFGTCEATTCDMSVFKNGDAGRENIACINPGNEVGVPNYPGASCSIRCNDGYEVSGEEITCGGDGQWSGPVQTCAKEEHYTVTHTFCDIADILNGNSAGGGWWISGTSADMDGIEVRVTAAKSRSNYLACYARVTNDDREAWSMTAKVEIRLVPAVSGTDDKLATYPNGQFSEDGQFWGNAEVIPIDEVLDPANGYLSADGSLTIQLDIYPIAKDNGVPRSLDVVKMTQTFSDVSTWGQSTDHLGDHKKFNDDFTYSIRAYREFYSQVDMLALRVKFFSTKAPWTLNNAKIMYHVESGRDCIYMNEFILNPKVFDHNTVHWGFNMMDWDTLIYSKLGFVNSDDEVTVNMIAYPTEYNVADEELVCGEYVKAFNPIGPGGVDLAKDYVSVGKKDSKEECYQACALLHKEDEPYVNVMAYGEEGFRTKNCNCYRSVTRFEGEWLNTEGPGRYSTNFIFCQIQGTSFADVTKECMTGNGKYYFGSVSTTADGVDCADWDEDDHYFLFSYDDNLYYDQEAAEAFEQVHASGNKCRNPTDDPKGPYCFTKTDLSTDYNGREDHTLSDYIKYCDVPTC